MSSKGKLVHPIFLLSISLLLANDFFLKAFFHNELTGKLSDFAGLFAFPFFWSAIFPKRVKWIHLVTAIAFLLWKSQWSEGLINLVNSLGLQTFRSVDWTDNIALVSIIGSYGIFCQSQQPESRPFVIRAIAILSIFSFVATTQEKAPTYQDEFKWINFQNQGTQQLIVIVNFKYSNTEITADTTLNNEFNRIDTLRISSGNYGTFRTPIFTWRDTKFPRSFRITVSDSLGKLQKVYNKDTFFKALDTTANHQSDSLEHEEAWMLRIGKKKPEKIAAHTIYGRWQTISSSARLHTFEIREQYYYDVEPEGNLAKYELQDSIITVIYPKKSIMGRVTHLNNEELSLKWDNLGALKYKKLYR